MDESKFITYPTNKVVCVINDLRQADAARAEIEAAGVGGEVETFSGVEGEHQLDFTGEEHGFYARLVRHIEHWQITNESDHINRYEQEIHAGHTIIMVEAPEPRDRDRVEEILRKHGGHFINFYGRWAIYPLKP